MFSFLLVGKQAVSLNRVFPEASPALLPVLKPLSKDGTLPLVRMGLVIDSKIYCGNLFCGCIPSQQDLFSSLYYTVTALLSVIQIVTTKAFSD
jgi:hypothetical protein